MSYQYRKQRNAVWPSIMVVLLLIVLVVAGGMFFLKPKSTASNTPETKKSATQPAKEEPVKTMPAKPTLVNLQPTVDSWVNGQTKNYGIVVYDPANDAVIATHQGDKLFFTASMYKLSVAYLTLKDFQSGAQNPDEVILAGQTRKQCVYKMIHSSDSPCGETVLNSLGQKTVGQRNITELGLTNAIFPGFQTTSADMVKILQRLQANKDLNAENTAFLLDAMKTQIYRNGVPAGMPAATVADKIGFDSPDLWVDGGIIYLPNGRQYIYCIFGNGGVGSTNIRNFAETIYPVLNN